MSDNTELCCIIHKVMLILNNFELWAMLWFSV